MLLKVFIVDDEIATREGIRSSFLWDDKNFTLVGEAPDGEIALPMIADEKPDVVITDIRMPFMDGLALSRAIRRSMPWIHIVILSGYSDFDYAKQAISLGVDEYLLKPVTAEDLREVLERLRTKTQEEKKRREEEKQLRTQMASGITFLQDKLLGSLLSEQTDAQGAAQMRSQMENLGIHITAPVYNVLDIRFQYSGSDDRERGRSILQSLADSSGEGILLTRSNNGAFALVMDKSREEIEERCYAYASTVVYTLEQDGAENVLVSIGEPCEDLQGVHDSMRTARHVRHILDARNEPVHRKIVGVQEMEDTPLHLQNLEIQPLYEQIQYVKPEDFGDVFHAYIRSIYEAAPHPELSDDYLLMEAALTASRIVREAGGDPGQILNLKDYESAMQPDMQTSVPDTAETLLRKALSFRDHKNPLHGNRAVMNACSYLSRNFTDPTLMLQDAAKAAGMSHSRFSTVFSQEMGVTFTEYLTNLRMAKAKELLRATQLRSSEISSAVGYSDRHYFSYLFKKNTGMTPSEFREKNSTLFK